MKIKIKSKDVDLSTAFPLTMGEGRQLIKLAGSTTGSGDVAAQWDATVALAMLVIGKICPDVEARDLENMPLPDFTAMVRYLQREVQASAGQVDRPT